MDDAAGAEDRRESLRLTKWYLDCVDADGNAGIAYWATITWHGLSMEWQRVTRYPFGRAPVEWSSMQATPAPTRTPRGVTWTSPAVSCAVEYEAAAAPVETRLLESAAGNIDWRCETTGARARFNFGDGAPLVGTGYVERIELTILPWRLPIDELRWGRWIADDAQHSVVWIDWRGPLPQTLVLSDGVVHGGAGVADTDVTWPTGSLALSERRLLHEEDVSAVVRHVPGLSRLLRGTPLAMRDHKWCSRGVRTMAGEAPLSGWAIHEIVWMR